MPQKPVVGKQVGAAAAKLKGTRLSCRHCIDTTSGRSGTSTPAASDHRRHALRAHTG
jgi:hypothetical protein